jgi:hypothetical protein
MMPVPSYQLIPFLVWLHNRGIRMSPEGRGDEPLEQLAIEFLQAGGGLAFENLVGAMAIFQACPMIDDADIEAQMRHFAACGQCIDYIAERGERFKERGGAIWPIGGGSEDALHPLLRGFVGWARGLGLESRLRFGSRQDAWDSGHSSKVFHAFIREFGEELLEHFNRYLEEARRRTPDLVEDYERWRRNGRHREPGTPHQRPRLSDQNTHPLGSNESIEQAARRLADSVRLGIDSGFYDDIIAEEPQIARLFSLVMDSQQNVPQAIEFVSWLRQREPDLRIQGSMPSNEFASLALRFCEEKGYSNGQSFSQEAQQWLGGSGSHRVIDRIARFLGAKWGDTRIRGRKKPNNPLDRYGAVRFHGLFLFLSSGDFPSFIEAHWRDLNHLTGDYLDIYFSQKDLTKRTSGYEIVSELRSVSLRVDSLPALLLWEEKLEKGVTVSLRVLEHDQIVEVVQAVVQAIREGCSLGNVSERGTNRAEELRAASSGALIVQSGASLVINNGGVMGNVYKNKGVVGAMGENPIVHDNVFLLDARKLLSDITLTEEEASVINQLAEALASQQIKGLALPERLEGARHLAVLAQAAKEGNSLDEPLAGWRKWMSSLSEGPGQVLSVLANVATIAGPVAKLLGLPL